LVDYGILYKHRGGGRSLGFSAGSLECARSSALYVVLEADAGVRHVSLDYADETKVVNTFPHTALPVEEFTHWLD
jgi:hypothetical protein